jgi:ribonuclease P protein component
MRFRPDQHLRRQADFDHVRATGRRYDGGAFVVFHAPRREPDVRGEPSADATPSPAPATAPAVELVAPARAGFVASRSAVGNAVARARAKRRLREGFRACQAAFPPGYDFIFVARRALNGLEHAALEERFSTLCRKLFPSSAH